MESQVIWKFQGVYVHLQPVQDTTAEEMVAWRRLPGRTCGSWREELRTSSLWAGLMIPLKGCTGAPSSWRTEACGRDTLEQVVKNCSPVGRTHTGEFHGGLSLLWTIPCWRKRKKEKVEAEKNYMMSWLYSQLPALLGGGEKIRDEAKLRKEEDMEGRQC